MIVKKKEEERVRKLNEFIQLEDNRKLKVESGSFQFKDLSMQLNEENAAAFFANSDHIKLGSPQAAQQSISFMKYQ